jgi:hypothetical protein
MNIKKALKELNKELKRREKSFDLYTCGGAGLNLLGVSSRDTVDIDVIEEELDLELIDAKNAVAKKLRISEEWLNNKVSPLIKRLPKGWKKTCVEVFSESHLVVFVISRQDFINSKFHACVDRHAEDYEDLLSLHPKPLEIRRAKKYVLREKENIETYEIFVNAIIKRLKKDLEYDDE